MGRAALTRHHRPSVCPSARPPAATDTSRRTSASGNSPRSRSRSGFRQDRGDAQAQRGESARHRRAPARTTIPGGPRAGATGLASPEGPKPLPLTWKWLCVDAVRAGLSQGSSCATPGLGGR